METTIKNRKEEIINYLNNDSTSILNTQFNSPRKIYIDDNWMEYVPTGYSELEILDALKELAFTQVKPTVKTITVRTAIQIEIGKWKEFGETYKFKR